jgi:hypothetical protein
VVLVNVLEHVEPGRIRAWLTAAREFAALVLVMYGLAIG